MSFKYILIICFVNYALCDDVKENKKNENDNDLLSSIEEKMEFKIGQYAGYITDYLKAFNDKRLIKSELGRLLHYEDIKPNVEGPRKEGEVEGRSAKRMAALIPLIFHIGMASAWMLMTTILTAKSVAIGMTLLVMKIAVGSAKIASYFTAWKAKHHHHHGYHDHGWTPHHEHHDSERSFNEIEHHPTHEWPAYAQYAQYAQDWAQTAGSEYKFSSPYHTQSYGEYEYAIDPKKTLEKKRG